RHGTSRDTMTAAFVSGKNRPQCDSPKTAKIGRWEAAASCMGPESRPTKPADRAMIPSVATIEGGGDARLKCFDPFGNPPRIRSIEEDSFSFPKKSRLACASEAM